VILESFVWLSGNVTCDMSNMTAVAGYEFELGGGCVQLNDDWDGAPVYLKALEVSKGIDVQYVNALLPSWAAFGVVYADTVPAFIEFFDGSCETTNDGQRSMQSSCIRGRRISAQGD
jgi:hypothetical protein